MKPFAIFLTLWLAFPAQGQTPIDPSKPVVVFPTDPAPPAPAPSSIINLTGDVAYVIHSNVPCVVLASPQGILNIAPDTGPMKFMLKSWPSGTAQTLNLTDKYLYFVTVQSPGTAELLLIEPGGTKVTRKTFFTGVKPDPAPDPNPPPGPNPLPSDKLRVLTVYETADKLTSAQNVVLKSDIPQQAIKAAGGDYMCLDQNNDPTKYTADQWWKDAWKRKPASASPPKIIISSPKGFYEGDIPASVADFTTLLKKY